MYQLSATKTVEKLDGNVMIKIKPTPDSNISVTHWCCLLLSTHDSSIFSYCYLEWYSPPFSIHCSSNALQYIHVSIKSVKLNPVGVTDVVPINSFEHSIKSHQRDILIKLVFEPLPISFTFIQILLRPEDWSEYSQHKFQLNLSADQCVTILC